MKNRKGIVSLVLGFIIALGVFSGGTTEASTVYSGNFPMVQGQIGRVIILKTTTLWKLGSNSQLTFSRTLHPGRQYRVYNFSSIQGGLYGLGGGYYVKKNPTYVKYETPSKTNQPVNQPGTNIMLINQKDHKPATNTKLVNQLSSKKETTVPIKSLAQKNTQPTSGKGSPSQTTTQSLIYRNAKYGFSLKLPDDWRGHYRVAEDSQHSYGRLLTVSFDYVDNGTDYGLIFDIFVYPSSVWNSTGSGGMEEKIASKNGLTLSYIRSEEPSTLLLEPSNASQLKQAQVYWGEVPSFISNLKW